MAKAGTGRRRRKLGWVILLALIVAGAGGWAAVTRPWVAKPLSVKVETMALGPVSQVLAVNGRIAAKRSVVLRATVQARVVSVGADVGDTVTEGQLLTQLDDSQQKLLVQQALAALDAGEARRDQGKINLERAQALGDNVTRASLDSAETEYRAAENEVSGLQAVLEQAENQLEQYAVRSPLDGVVLARGAETGQLVDAQSELFTVADLGDLLVETDVDELYSSQMKVGLKALLKPAGGTAAQTGVVSFAAPTVDPDTGGRAIKIAFDTPVSLPIGLTVNANIIVEENPSALSVPRAAVLTDGARTYVMVEEAGVAKQRDVGIIDWPADRLEITSGLAEGDRVIVDPSKVKTGQAVAGVDG